MLQPNCTFAASTQAGPRSAREAIVTDVTPPRGRAADGQSIQARVEPTYTRSVETVRASIKTLRALLAVLRDLARLPDHEASAKKRLARGKRELAVLEAELEALEQGDVETAMSLHESSPVCHPRRAGGPSHS